MDKEFYIHVGFMKTGTTFLQKSIYPKLCDDEIVYLSSNHEICLSLIRFARQGSFAFPIPTMKDIVKKELFAIPQKKIIISWEGLVGKPELNHSDFEIITLMLKEVFENVKIIMTIRNQTSYVESMYIQALQTGYVKSFARYSNFNNKEFREYRYILSNNKNLDVRTIDYLRFYKRYVDIFGESNVLCLPYEMMRSDMDSFLEKLVQFIGITTFSYKEIVKNKRANRSFSQISIYISKLLNKVAINEFSSFGLIIERPFENFLRYRRERKILNYAFIVTQYLTIRTFLQRGLDKLIYIRPRVLSKKQELMISSIHTESNKELSKLIGIELSDYMYY